MKILKMICPDEAKLAIRRKHLLHEVNAPSRSFDEALTRSKNLWSAYEQVNRDFCPEDPVYSISNPGAALNTSADNLALQASPSGQGRALEIIIGGESTSSTVTRVSVQRAGTTYTANLALSPEKFNSRSPSAQGIYGKNGTQALAGNPMLSLALNTFGGFVRWVAAPGEELYYLNSEIISMRSATGTPTVSSTIVFEEL